MKNLNAIVWLYRGEKEKYQDLIREYRHALFFSADESWKQGLKDALLPENDFAVTLDRLNALKAKAQAEAKEAVNQAGKRDKKSVQAAWDAYLAEIDALLVIAREAVWLTEKFGEGEYRDVPGLCKLSDRSEIEAKGWSLTPGAYVGVEAVKDDGVDFAARMKEIHQELLALQVQSNALMETISKNMGEMGL